MIHNDNRKEKKEQYYYKIFQFSTEDEISFYFYSYNVVKQ